jgi:hypothetical protein
MTNILHLPARPGAPIACDMSGACDTMEARLREYTALFSGALLRRERRAGAVVFEFGEGTREAVVDLARREAACCPFLDYRVESVAERVRWTISAPPDAGADAVLDAFHTLAGGEDAAVDTLGACDDVRSGAWPPASSPSRASTASPAGAGSCAG